MIIPIKCGALGLAGLRSAAPQVEIRHVSCVHVRQSCATARIPVSTTQSPPRWVLHAVSPPASAGDLQPQSPWSDKELELLWESVARPLMKFGQAGAQETHIR